MPDNITSIEITIKKFVRTSTLNSIPGSSQPIFDEPLIKFADGDDELFSRYKTIISPMHFTPREAMAVALDKKLEDLNSKISVISWILPITLNIRKSNRLEKIRPSSMWACTRWYGEKFNEALRKHVVKILMEKGYNAAAPAITPHFKQLNNEKGPYSNWSERHIAYAAGHGTFSLSDGFITEKGIAHRCGSAVTDLVLPASERNADSPYSNCIYYLDKSCKACIERCPAGAITESGHNKLLCRDYQWREFASLREELRVGNTGCGLCQTKVPCEFKNPVRKRK
jgi:epoxyqueuosine reductase